MSWTRVVAARVRNFFRRYRLERELDDEIRFHLEMQIEDNLRSRMTLAEARNAALRSFGGVEAMKESYRDRRALPWLENAARDVRYGTRSLRKTPGYTATAVAVLALAIGGNTAMFSVLRAVLLRPLPYRDPERLAMLWTTGPGRGAGEDRSAYWNIEEWRARAGSFDDLAFFDPASVTLTGGSEAERIRIVWTSPELFDLLGIAPLAGRAWSAREAERRERVALISYGLWQRRFGGGAGAIGASIEIDGAPWRIAGVMPAIRVADADVWAPHTLAPNWESLRRARGAGGWFVVGRLRGGVSIEQARTEMRALARRLDEQSPPSGRAHGVNITPLDLQVVGASSRAALWMLTGAVLFVLLIAATNVASLSLARAASREKELAIRAALGASRGRIAGQLLAESLILAAVAGLTGLALAWAGIRVLVALRPGNLARFDETTLDWQALGWTVALCLLAGIVVGIAPALTIEGRKLAGRRARRALVATQFALAIVLLAGAGLLLRSLWSVQRVELGFRPERVLSVQLSTPAALGAGQRAALYRDLLRQVEALPGIESAGVIGDLFVGGAPERVVSIEGGAVERVPVRLDEVSDRVFETLRAPLRRGRFFSAEDSSSGPRTAIINDEMARALWPAGEAVGKRVKLGPPESDAAWLMIVGVVGDMRRQGLEKAPVPQIFVPLAQNPSRLATLLVRTSAENPLRMLGAVRDAARRIAPGAAVYAAMTLDGTLDIYLSERRFQTSLLVGFALTALFMAALGIYGLVQFSITTRTREIGIRIAVGARSGEIFRMVLREGVNLSIAGVALGLFGSIWLGRATSGLLFGVTAVDLPTLTAVSVVLIAVAAAACYFPARRAMKIDPVAALRRE